MLLIQQKKTWWRNIIRYFATTSLPYVLHYADDGSQHIMIFLFIVIVFIRFHIQISHSMPYSALYRRLYSSGCFSRISSSFSEGTSLSFL